MTDLELQARIGEIAIELLGHRNPLIKMTATNKETGRLIFTIYGIVQFVDNFCIVFDTKFWLQNNRLIVDKTNQEFYTKNHFEYDIEFLDNFTDEDYFNLLSISLLDIPMPYSIYNVIINHLFINDILKNE